MDLTVLKRVVIRKLKKSPDLEESMACIQELLENK